jgi:hypothetical protein
MSRIVQIESSLPPSELDRMAEHFYGYGRWDAPYWFIGPETHCYQSRYGNSDVVICADMSPIDLQKDHTALRVRPVFGVGPITISATASHFLTPSLMISALAECGMDRLT